MIVPSPLLTTARSSSRTWRAASSPATLANAATSSAIALPKAVTAAASLTPSLGLVRKENSVTFSHPPLTFTPCDTTLHTLIHLRHQHQPHSCCRQRFRQRTAALLRRCCCSHSRSTGRAASRPRPSWSGEAAEVAGSAGRPAGGTERGCCRRRTRPRDPEQRQQRWPGRMKLQLERIRPQRSERRTRASPAAASAQPDRPPQVSLRRILARVVVAPRQPEWKLRLALLPTRTWCRAAGSWRGGDRRGTEPVTGRERTEREEIVTELKGLPFLQNSSFEHCPSWPFAPPPYALLLRQSLSQDPAQSRAAALTSPRPGLGT